MEEKRGKTGKKRSKGEKYRKLKNKRSGRQKRETGCKKLLFFHKSYGSFFPIGLGKDFNFDETLCVPAIAYRCVLRTNHVPCNIPKCIIERPISRIRNMQFLIHRWPPIS